MSKLTMKAKVLNFVESKGTARYMEIVKFIVDTKFGSGTYETGRKIGYDGKIRNSFRGYYSSAFVNHCSKHRGRFNNSPKGYFLNDVGYGCLVKMDNGNYKTIR